jgi:hypothetical protein
VSLTAAVVATLLAATLLVVGCGDRSDDTELSEEARCAAEIGWGATQRDADAQALVDQVDTAVVTAENVRDDLPLTTIVVMSPLADTTLYQFVAKGKPLVSVRFDANGQAYASVINTGQPWPKSEPQILTLADLVMGQERALKTIQEAYPSAEIMALGLSRDDCRR